MGTRYLSLFILGGSWAGFAFSDGALANYLSATLNLIQNGPLVDLKNGAKP